MSDGQITKHFTKLFQPLGAAAHCKPCNVDYTLLLHHDRAWTLHSFDIWIKFPVHIKINIHANSAQIKDSLTNIIQDVDINYFITNPLTTIKKRIQRLIPFI